MVKKNLERKLLTNFQRKTGCDINIKQHFGGNFIKNVIRAFENKFHGDMSVGKINFAKLIISCGKCVHKHNFSYYI